MHIRGTIPDPERVICWINFAALIIFLRFSVVSKIHENAVWCARMIAGNSKKLTFSIKNLSKNRKLRKYFFRNSFFIKVSGKSHSGENLEQSFMLAKSFVSGKNWGGFDEKKLEKKSHRQNVTCWVWENLISKQKLFILKNLTMPKTVKWGLWDFLTSILLQNFRKKLKGDPLETLKKQKKMKIFKFHSAQKFGKRDPLGNYVFYISNKCTFEELFLIRNAWFAE